ncbi:MAG TPA: glycerophosphodiester phosphodiesterase family protein [Pyrinomonadaceae bacterium]
MTSDTLPLIIGHRGAAAVAPENTLASFARAYADGAQGIEFDVRLARDGVPVVIHDATLRRTAARPEAVAALTAAELARADVGSWFNRRRPAHARAEYARAHVPTLAEVLALTAPLGGTLYVELKCDRAEEAAPLAARAVEVLLTDGATHDLVVESFTHAAVVEVKRLAPDLRTAALFDRRLTRPHLSSRTIITQARACGADEVALHHTLANARTVAAAHAAGLPVVVWTVDNPVRLLRLATLGVRAVITNDPARMVAALKEILRRTQG